MLKRTIGWQGVDDDNRHDVATIRLDADRLGATGTSTTPDYRLAYSLRTGPDWITRSLDVSITGAAGGQRTWSRELALARDPDGRWHAEGRAAGIPVSAAGQPITIEDSDWSAVDGTVPGIVDDGSLAGADDCDLGLCPVTNTMPMLRTILRRQAVAGPQPGPEVDFVMAWVEVPSLRVLRSEQTYQLRRTAVDGTAVVRYLGLHRSFEADLDVDRDGLVIDYPQLANRVTLPR